MEYAVSRLTTDVSRVFKDTHIRTLLSATYDNSMSMSELFRFIGARLRDERWIVVLKSLSLIHLLAREGNSERLLGFLCANTDVLYQSFFRQHGPVSTKIIKGYSAYLEEKAGAYRTLKYDWVRQQDEAVARFRSMDDENQLIKESELLQKQIQAALGCAWECDGMTDVVIQQAFRFILAEYFNLFLLSNESIVKVLGLYFQMERRNATKALELYKTFVSQTKKIQDVFQMAKQNLPMRVEIPNFNIPPVGLVAKLEDYLNSSDHEEKRLAAKAGKSYAETPTEQKHNSYSLSQPPSGSQVRNTSASAIPAKEKPLIDFFNSVEEEYVSQPTTSPDAYSNGWNDQFSQQAAMQSNIQTQIQLTNQLLYSGGDASKQQFPLSTGGFSQSGFNMGQPTMFPPPQQNNGFGQFVGGNQSNNFGAQSNPFAQPTAPSISADPFSSLGATAPPPLPTNNMSNLFTGMSGGFANNSFAQSNGGAANGANRFGGVPNNSYVSNTGTFNNFGGAGSTLFASTAGGFGNIPANAPNASGVFQQQSAAANPFVQPAAIHNPAAFAVDSSAFGTNTGNTPFLTNQLTGASSGSNNPFAGQAAMNGYGNNGSFRQLPSSNVAQNQGSLASQFHASNQANPNLNNNSVGGAYNTYSAPRVNQGLNMPTNLSNDAFVSLPSSNQQAAAQQQQSNNNPFF